MSTFVIVCPTLSKSVVLVGYRPKLVKTGVLVTLSIRHDIIDMKLIVDADHMMRYLSGKDIDNEQEENVDELDEANRMKREEHDRILYRRNLNSEIFGKLPKKKCKLDDTRNEITY
ncbi:hypothetical protein CDAR_367031 [Caerostris darwini]|uniref:Uncharacterized protein n=1 Tax=Caerostris darwini TaxID=1538125 RepID=A0AAV4WNA3_9ARAC|nr:hypothetical protein CDAR_367031 [Caerostris darwini]